MFISLTLLLWIHNKIKRWKNTFYGVNPFEWCWSSKFRLLHLDEWLCLQYVWDHIKASFSKRANDMNKAIIYFLKYQRPVRRLWAWSATQTLCPVFGWPHMGNTGTKLLIWGLCFAKSVRKYFNIIKMTVNWLAILSNYRAWAHVVLDALAVLLVFS